MAKNILIKKPYMELEYSIDQINELKKCSEDPIYFIKNYCWIQHPIKGRVRFILRPYQERFIRALVDNTLTLVLSGRQSGKSQSVSGFVTWYSCFHSDAKILIASNGQKGATDLMNRIKYMYESLPDFLRPGCVFYNRGSMEFDNGSVVWSEATTEDTGRGRSPSMILVDELAHIAPRIQEAMYASILPTISTGGRGVFMSTPNGDSDLFAQLCRGAEAGINGFHLVKVTIDEVPDRGKEWQDKERAKIGDLKFQQEYLCEFLSSDPLLINSLVLQSIKPMKPIFADKGFSFYKDIDPLKTYIIGCDISQGLSGDFSTIEIFELQSLEQVAEFRSNTVKEDVLYGHIKWIIQKLISYKDNSGNPPYVYWSYENNSIGATFAVLYNADEKFPDHEKIELISMDTKLGLATTAKSKPQACRTLKNILEKPDGLKINSEMLLVELKNYVQKGSSFAAKYGATDDLVSAVLIIMQILNKLAEYEDTVFDLVYKSSIESDDSFDEPYPFLM